MNRLVTLFALLAILVGLVSAQTVSVTRAYSYPLKSVDSVANGLSSIRGCAVGDLNNDGKPEIVLSNYAYNGSVSVLATVGNDSLKLVWTSPYISVNGGGSTPRIPIVGDLDNDGKKEVIFQSSGNGIFIYEWDGVSGSYNFGTTASQVISASFSTSATTLIGYTEYMEVSDVDGDSMQELLVAMRIGVSARGYYIVSGSGDWSTNDPGFSDFTVEYKGIYNTDLKAWGMGGGSPLTMMSANFDGTGRREILMHTWDNKAITVMTVTGADTYLLADTLTGKAFRRIGTTGSDDCSLFGGVAADIDKDGREEIYLPTFPNLAAGQGKVDMISYNVGESLRQVDSVNATRMDISSVVNMALFGSGWGDIDADGKREVYVSSSYPKNLVSLEFQGGDKRNPASWTTTVLYAGDSTIYTAISIKDSAGVKDTVRTVDPSFVSKFWARKTDLDGDGKEDIICPYQALSDSITVTKRTWNTGTVQFDTVKTMMVNPKRWALRVVEGSATTGIEVKDLTIIMPDQYTLEQNYPNPFNPSTTIAFVLPMRDRISLKIYDALGREVRTLINNEEFAAGRSTAVWNGRNDAGRPVSSGTYFYTLIHGNFRTTNKMTLVK